MNDIKTLPEWAQELIGRYEHDVTSAHETIANLTGTTPTDVYYGGFNTLGFLPTNSIVTFEVSPDRHFECALREWDGKRVLDIRAYGADGNTIAVENREGHVKWLSIVSHQDVIDQLREEKSTGIELEQLCHAIRRMSVRSSLYRILKKELSERGWWKNRPRGKPGNPNRR